MTYHDFDAQAIASALGGEAREAAFSRRVRDTARRTEASPSRLIRPRPKAFVVHSFAGDDPIVCRDYVRQKCGLPEFKPNGDDRRRADAGRSR